VTGERARRVATYADPDDGATLRSMEAEEVPAGALPQRYLAVDDRNTGLRATWRPAHGIVNLSLWRGRVCVETFHLPPEESARLVGFLAGALSSAAARPGRAALTVVPDVPATRRARRSSARTLVRDRVATALERAARSIRNGS
jgi:hypothetical protein